MGTDCFNPGLELTEILRIHHGAGYDSPYYISGRFRGMLLAWVVLRDSVVCCWVDEGDGVCHYHRLFFIPEG